MEKELVPHKVWRQEGAHAPVCKGGAAVGLWLVSQEALIASQRCSAAWKVTLRPQSLIDSPEEPSCTSLNLSVPQCPHL